MPRTHRAELPRFSSLWNEPLCGVIELRQKARSGTLIHECVLESSSGDGEKLCWCEAEGVSGMHVFFGQCDPRHEAIIRPERNGDTASEVVSGRVLSDRANNAGLDVRGQADLQGDLFLGDTGQ